MRKPKSYAIDIHQPNDVVVDGPAPWVMKVQNHSLDFRKWRHLHGDINNPLADRGQLLDQMRDAIWGYRHELSESTLKNLYQSGLCVFFGFIDSTDITLRSIQEIDEEILLELVSFLKRQKHHSGELVSYVTAKTRYSTIKTMLSYFSRVGLFDKKIFPSNPFPNVNRHQSNTTAYSKSEMTDIMRALTTEHRAIIEKRSVLSPRSQLAVYLQLIIAKTGLNQTPLIEATRDCLQPHPLQPDKAMVLVTKKRRGMNTHAISMRRNTEVEGINALPNSVATLINEALAMTAPLIGDAKATDVNKIWLYFSQTENKVMSFKELTLGKAIMPVSRIHDLKDDLGKDITISSKRLRKTFAERIWQLTNGDVWKTSRILGNTPSVTNQHYLDVTPAMERQHKFVGTALEMNVRGLESDSDTINRFSQELKVDIEVAKSILSGANNTAVSRCSSPVSGKYANGDGSPCGKFIECFRCPNQIVLEDDLYRLFSFYFRLLNERSAIGRKNWKRLYSWVIREIDNEISPKFGRGVVAKAREKARFSPHPMWAKHGLAGGTYE